MTGRQIAQDAAESAITATRYYTCPWALARHVAPLLPLHRAVAAGRCSLTEYLGGQASKAAHDLMDVLDIELPLARAALARRKVPTK